MFNEFVLWLDLAGLAAAISAVFAIPLVQALFVGLLGFTIVLWGLKMISRLAGLYFALPGDVHEATPGAINVPGMMLRQDDYLNVDVDVAATLLTGQQAQWMVERYGPDVDPVLSEEGSWMQVRVDLGLNAPELYYGLTGPEAMALQDYSYRRAFPEEFSGGGDAEMIASHNQMRARRSANNRGQNQHYDDLAFEGAV